MWVLKPKSVGNFMGVKVILLVYGITGSVDDTMGIVFVDHSVLKCMMFLSRINMYIYIENK